MKTFTFDASCAASIIVKAENEDAAREIAKRALEGMRTRAYPLIGLKELTVSYHHDDAIELTDEEEQS